MQVLGVLPGDSSSRADFINDNGMVVGASEGSGGVRAFMWTSAGGIQPLSSSLDGTYNEAFAVNNQGQIVGETAGSLGTRAFLWTSQNGMVDLNDLVSNLPGDTVLIGAFGINDKGQIVDAERADQHREIGRAHV